MKDALHRAEGDYFISNFGFLTFNLKTIIYNYAGPV